MSLKAYDMWVGGEMKRGRGDIIEIEDPSSGEAFANFQAASAEDVHEAIQLAHATFKSGTWSRASRHDRAAVLDRMANLLTAELPVLVPLEVQQSGRAIREISTQLTSLEKWFRYYASLLRTEERSVFPTTGKLHNWADRQPLGVCVLITPFNHPLLIAVKKIAPALAAGNSIILKPSELTPITSVLLGPIFAKAGLPSGVFNVLPGDGPTTGRAMVSHPLTKKVDVTGSTNAGRIIGGIASSNLAHFTAELGGKAPLIVFKEADLDAAVNGIAFGSFMASGQTCIAATRVIVHSAKMADVLEKLSAKCKSIAARMGSPQNSRSMMGPLISEKQLKNVIELVDDAVENGAQAVTGGARLSEKSMLDETDFSRGYFFPPTVLTMDDNSKLTDLRIWREEAFGPVIVVAGFETEEEAIRLANDTEFGLGAAIWTTDLSQAFRVSEMIEAGICWVNTHHRNDPSSPWGGVGSSGVGTENGIEAYHAYTTLKSTIINFASTQECIATDDWFREGDGETRYG